MKVLSMISRKFDYTIKTVIVGDSGVGKTCFLVRFIRDIFDDCSQPTLGVDFLSKIVETKQGRRVELQIWDTAGQELFRSVTRGYYRGCAIAFLVFDLTNHNSFKNIERWLSDVKDVAPPKVIPVLIGNKEDLSTENSVSREEAEKFAAEHQMKYFTASAKTGTGVSEAILSSVEKIDQSADPAVFSNQNENIIFEGEDDKAKDSSCC